MNMMNLINKQECTCRSKRALLKIHLNTKIKLIVIFFKRCVTWKMKKDLNSDLNIETEKINSKEENKIGGA